MAGINLLRAKKQIHDEAKEFLYKDATFELVLYLAKPPVSAQTVHVHRLPALIPQIPMNCPFWNKIEKLRVISYNKSGGILLVKPHTFSLEALWSLLRKFLAPFASAYIY